MAKYIFLDSAPLSLLASPAKTGGVRAISNWARDCDIAGHHLIIPEIVDYELRRELLRGRKQTGLARLDDLIHKLTFLPISTAAMLKAAELWAATRQQGNPTAHDENIDVDVILAAQALTLGVPLSDLVVATVNKRHLTLFLTADRWDNITP